MAGEVHGVARWPGALSVQACTYTLSHGMSPGMAVLKMNPQSDVPALFGDLVFTDGVNGLVTLPGCKLQSIKVERDDQGIFWSVEILDRRWRWRDLGYINGCYNQLAPLGQQHLIPWTIRSPTELAVLCLTAMGETNYELYLPPGLNYPGPFYPLPIINTSGVNPPVNWEGVPPGQALQEVCDRCGCRLIYRWSTDSILIAPVGRGAFLPPGSIHKRGPTLTTPPAPSGVGVIGDPTRYQCRLALAAVGKEWDGSYRPINLLSYAPKTPGKKGQPQKSTVQFGNYADNVDWKVSLTDNKGNTVTEAYVSQPGDSLTTVCIALANQINASADAQWKAVSAQAAAPNIIVTGKKNGVAFNLSASVFVSPDPSPAPTAAVQMTQAAEAAVAGGVSWANSMPPLFPNVSATDQLTQADAQCLAQESVFRCYQLTGVDVSGNGTPNIPGYGPVLRMQQIVLTDSQVDQITPEPQDSSVVLSNPTILPPDANNSKNVLIPLTVNFYAGYAQDKPAAVYGQIAQQLVINNIWYPGAAGSLATPAGSQVHVPFSVEPDFFLIRFSAPVYMLNVDGTVQMPDLTLQTAVYVRDPANNQLISFTRIQELPGGDPTAPPQMRHYPDVQLNVTSGYEQNGTIGLVTLLEADPILRADYYLAAMAYEYQIKGGQIVEYNGIRSDIDLDGLTWQITWGVGGEGCSTVVSQNCEHSIWVPPYPARRRAEFLPPVTRVDANGTRVNLIDVALGGK